jgi:hypothetical protein
MNPKLPTVEIFSVLSKTSGPEDLWDELNREQNQSFNSIFFYFQEEREYQIRLLGPFIKAKRIFIPKEFPKSLVSLLDNTNLNPEVLRKKIEGIESVFPRIRYSAKDKDAYLNFIDTLKTQKGWSPIILTNAIAEPFDNSPIKIIAITPRMASALAYADPTNRTAVENMKITGLTAHDILVIKRGVGLASNFVVRFSDSLHTLSQKTIDKIMLEGLWDIKRIIEDSPKKGAFIYAVANSYRMPDKLNNTMFKELVKIEENKHHDAAEEHINEIPKEAFENFNQANNAINSLEI